MSEADESKETLREDSATINETQTIPVQMSARDVKIALKNNMEFLIQFFLKDEITHRVPNFHVRLLLLMISFTVSRLAIAVPRGHAKTTLAKLAVVWYFLFSKIRFIVYLSNTTTIAANACLDIIKFLESDNFVAVFGPVNWLVRREGEGFYKFYIGEKMCILRAIGMGQQVRGLNIDNQRPELAVCDDVEDDENTATPELRQKSRKWFFAKFLKALARPNPKVIYIGNMLSIHSLLAHFCKSPFWHSWRFGCLLSNGEPLWPDLWPIEAIKRDFAEYKEAGMIPQWFAEMMNLPMPESSALIKMSEIEFAPARLPEEIKYGFITIDPAISEKTWANKSAIKVHGFVADTRKWQIVDGVSGKFNPEQVFVIVADLALKWRIGIAGIETGAMQASLEYLFNVYKQIYDTSYLHFVPLVARNEKTARLAGWCSMLRKGEYCLTEGDILIPDQLMNYDPTKKDNDDDDIDSAAYGPQMINNYIGMIMEYDFEQTIGVHVPIQGTYEVCNH